MSLLTSLFRTPHRIELEALLRKQLPQLSGSILDIGSKNRRYDHLLPTRPIAIDLIPDQSKGVLKGDVTHLDYPDQHFDSVVCLEVLEYLDSPDMAISEIFRVLKPGGKALVSIPFMYKEHDDKTRLTSGKLSELFSNHGKVTILPVGNGYSIILDIIRYALVSNSWLLLKILLVIPYTVFLLFLPLCRWNKNPLLASGYLIHTIKENK